MKIGFYVSGTAGRLNKLLSIPQRDLIECTEIVFSDDIRNSFLEDKLAEFNVPYFCMNYPDIEGKNKSGTLSDRLLSLLNKYKVDYCFCFGDHILKGELLEVYKNRIINFHPSLLPLYPGRFAIDQAIADNCNLLGNTAHFIDSGIDTGPIIMQNVLSYKVYEDLGYEGILSQQIPMIVNIFNLLKEDKIRVMKHRVQIIDADYGKTGFFPNI